MPTLQATPFVLELKDAKPVGLADLGVPLPADGPEPTRVKKGRLAEAMQPLDDGRIGRRYQNLRAHLLRAVEGGEPAVTLVLAFEVFGDDNAPVGRPSGIALRVLDADGTVLAEGDGGPLFLPWASFWYENRCALKLPLTAFDAACRLEVLAAADTVRPVPAAVAA